MAFRIVKTTEIADDVFDRFPGSFKTGHYHSWILSRSNFPEELNITAVDENNDIMAISHKQYHLTGLQFHPESVMTENGLQLIANWLNKYNLK